MTTFSQRAPDGVVGAVLAAAGWVDEGPVAVLLPDNVRIAGPPLLTAADLARAEERGVALAACHRVGPESRHYFGDVGNYRPADELADYRDPLDVLADRLEAEDARRIQTAASEELASAAEAALAGPLPTPDVIFKNIYAE